ncbi:zinc finger protein 592 [Periophthalmus magnuspinnatus]|uniref:zinc finger protein 592 n=1 Tax=Periophthalmus magnuspinnatus TaxID=409849 RepID=UPI0024363036|nr:zinc finger protein 592 [Periophthalmus magnuspinnatus]
MGDVKTPDFDDLLAAFDIPDATGLGSKETIQEGKGEVDSHLRPIGTCLEEGFPSSISADVPSVTVTLKKSDQHASLQSTTENCSTEQESRGTESDLAKNNTDKPFASLLNGDTSKELCELVALQQKPHETLSQQLSDLSSCSGSEAAKLKDHETHPNKQEEFFTNGLMQSINFIISKEEKCEQFETDKPKLNDKCTEEDIKHYNPSLDNATDTIPNSHNDCNKEIEPSKSANLPTSDSKSQSKLSSCLEALAALNSQNDPREFPTVERTKASPKAAFSPGGPCSPLDTVKRLPRPSDSPASVCSDSSGMASPPAIPRVRIKTIKTSSGHIRRTVASILPDSETEEVHSASESSPCQSMASEDSYNMSPSQNGKYSPKIVLNKSETIIRKLKSSGGMTNRRQSTVYKEQKPKKSVEAQSSANSNLPKAMHLASLNLVPHSVAASVAARSCGQSSVQTITSRVYSSVPLVHQINSACPPPPTKAAGTLNRLLHYANPVPTYVPDLNPPPESNIHLPPRGYRCLECGDSFGVERSLKYHYNRRSVHIEVSCTHCRKTLVFFNRCALLAHAREHKINGRVMQCTQLYMKPISEEQMFGAESPSGQSCFFKSSSQNNTAVMPLYQEHNGAPQRLSCMECNQQCSSLSALAGHYQSVSGDTSKLMCNVCSMILPNKCSFRAHQRVHAHKSPFCCPECGVLCRSADIQSHIKENCLHYARKAWYKCLHCDVMFKSLQGQQAHINEKHCELFFKCSVCPVAFKSSDRCETHLKNKHSISHTSPQLIFKCSCETIFKKKQLLYQHFHEDAYKRVKCVFKCPRCHAVFGLKQQLMQHFKITHTGPAEQHQDHHLQEKRSVSVKASDQSRAGTKAKRVKRYPCCRCDQSFNFTTSLKKHIRQDHDDKLKTFVCGFCTETTVKFTSSVTLKNHMSLMHGIKDADFDKMPKTLIQETNKPLRKAGSPPLGVKVANDDQTDEDDAPAEKRMKMSFRCAKCGFITSDGRQFEQHIPQHKLEENTPQCPHCGLCFTSALALNRHRHIVHKVREHEESHGQSQSREHEESHGQSQSRE